MIPNDGIAEVTFNLGQRTITYPFVVGEHGTTNVLFGWDFMEAFSGKVDAELQAFMSPIIGTIPFSSPPQNLTEARSDTNGQRDSRERFFGNSGETHSTGETESTKETGTMASADSGSDPSRTKN